MRQQLTTPKVNIAYRPAMTMSNPNQYKYSHISAFTTTKYLVNDDFADLLNLAEPVTRKEVQVSFIHYAINHDFCDLKAHHYLVYRHPKLKAMLGVDSLHPKNLFKYLRKMLVPI